MKHSTTTKCMLGIHRLTFLGVIVLAGAGLLLFQGSALAVHTSPGTIYVDITNIPSGDGTIGDPYRLIQQAVNHASPGDTIVISNGLYPRFTINGARAGERQLTVEPAQANGVVVQCGGNIGRGVQLLETERNIVRGLNFINCDIGGFLRNAQNNLISDNIFGNNNYGVVLRNDSANHRNVILDNEVHNNTYDGIFIQVRGGNRNVVQGNNSHNNGGYGYRSIENRWNVWQSNLSRRDDHGYRWDRERDLTGEFNRAILSPGNGFFANEVRFSSWDRTIARDNTGHGFVLHTSNNNHLVRNVSENNGGQGIDFRNSDGNTLHQATTEGNGGNGVIIRNFSNGNLINDLTSADNDANGILTIINSPRNTYANISTDANDFRGTRDNTTGGTGTLTTDNFYLPESNECLNDGIAPSFPAGLC